MQSWRKILVVPNYSGSLYLAILCFVGGNRGEFTCVPENWTISSYLALSME